MVEASTTAFKVKRRRKRAERRNAVLFMVLLFCSGVRTLSGPHQAYLFEKK
jgi:hypothetical protein